MTKILCTFAVIFIQPQQSVLTLADGWMWLSNLININTPRPMITASTQTTSSSSSTATATAAAAAAAPAKVITSSFKPSFYVATSFEVVLRISSLHLYHTY